MASVSIKEKSYGAIKKAKHFSYAILNVGFKSRKTIVDDVLPFRIRFTNITIPGYGPNNVPGIGIQVIGYSNYIL